MSCILMDMYNSFDQMHVNCLSFVNNELYLVELLGGTDMPFSFYYIGIISTIVIWNMSI